MPGDSNVDIKVQDAVISFSETYDGPNGAELLAYWQRLKGDRERPLWSDFDFLDIIKITPYLIIKDVVDGGREFRNRYWGTRMRDMDGIDATGKLLADYHNPDRIDEVLAICRLPLGNATPMIRRGKSLYYRIDAWREFTSLCVGFTNDRGEVTRLVWAHDE